MDTHILETSLVKAVKEQVSCDLGGESVILSLKSGEYFGLDPVGARVWSLIQEQTSVKALRDTILEEYDVEPEVCQRDLLALLKEMADQSLIEVQNEQDS